VSNYLKMPKKSQILALLELGWSYRRIEAETPVLPAREVTVNGAGGQTRTDDLLIRISCAIRGFRQQVPSQGKRKGPRPRSSSRDRNVTQECHSGPQMGVTR
jgi:hypothetical protein